MKKVNLEDGNASLKKVLLMMKYDTSKTLNENKVLLQEQEIPKGYRKIVGQDFVRGPKAEKIKQGLLELQSVEDFAALNKFHKAEVGFEIPRLLQNELGVGDVLRAKQIQDHLKKIGVQMTYGLKGPANVDGSSIKLLYIRKTAEPKPEDTKVEPKTTKPQFVEGPTKEEVKSGKKLLKSGMKGEFVKEVQSVLNALSSEQGNSNFFVGKVDGLFGGKTKKGLENYQISAGLKSDGVLGKDTFALLFRDKTEPLAVASKNTKSILPTRPESGVQRVPTLPAQNAHVDPQPVIRESLKKNLKTKLVEKTQEKENLLIESKITTNRFKLISEGLVIETDDDKIRFVETVIQETNYLVSQGYTSKSINEGLFSALGGLFGGSLKAIPAVFGEYIAKWLTKTLGVPQGSFIEGAIMALVGNLNIADYDKFFTDCRFASNKIADSLIEGYLIQMQNKMNSTSQGASGFIVSALRNAVAENFLEDKEGIIQILQDKIGDFICPKLAKVSNVIADKTEEIKDKAVA
jgi:peptidoglycan hydrolase-like protein with peptidoglycan-binding domain